MKILTSGCKVLDDCIYLSLNDWDDYTYKSTFNLSVYIRGVQHSIGEVKIIDEDKDEGRVIIDSGIEKLGLNYCSLGQSKEYYLALRKLGSILESEVLTALNDCAYDSSIYNLFYKTKQFQTSAVRFSTAEQALAFAKDIYSRGDKITDENKCHSFIFSTKLNGFLSNYELNFFFGDESKTKIPSNINVIIGRNGTGKTQILSELAKTVSGYGFENGDDLIKAREEKFKGTKHGFGNVIVVSYSAFDNFEIPGKNIAEQKELSEQGHIFGYKYCGLRERIDEDKNGDKYRLKNVEEITDDFVKNYQSFNEGGKLNNWQEKIKPVINDPSFSGLDNKNIVSGFKRLSSGQKIVLSILTSIYEHIEDNSLVIIDEPETHLHPSLIAAFMHSIRRMLTEFNSYAIIATHSPVILQETPSKYVQILKGTVDKPKVKKLQSECFGEEISTLTEDVFKVSLENSNFYLILKALAKQGYSVEEVERLFGKRLGMTAKSFLSTFIN